MREGCDKVSDLSEVMSFGSSAGRIDGFGSSTGKIDGFEVSAGKMIVTGYQSKGDSYWISSERCNCR